MLLVEDDPSNRRLVSRLLGNEGCEVLVSETARQALEIVDTRRIDVIVTDYMMPEMDGLELIRRLRAHHQTSEVPILMLTARSDRPTRLKALEAGASGFLSKPIDAAELSVRLRNLLSSKRSRDTLARKNEELATAVAIRTLEVRQTEAFLRSVIEASPDTILQIDRLGTIDYVSRLPADTSQDQVIGNTLAGWIPGADRHALNTAIGQALETGELTELELQAIPDREDSVLYQCRMQRSEADPEKLIVFVSNITELRETERALAESERQLRHAQRMESIGALAGGVAHDFNNLLSVIFSYGDTLREELPPGEAADDIEQILGAAKRASTLTRQLLAFSRKQVLRPKTTTLNKIVSNMEKMLRRLLREDIELSIYLDPNPSRVRVDVGQLEQVVMNLVVNARDAMPDGGSVQVSTKRRVIGEDAAAKLDVEPGEYALLIVSDSGHGMDETTQRRLFEPFYTTKDPGAGTGLGLSTVLGIVQQSQGVIELETRVNEGTTFVISLPTVEGAESGEFQAQSIPAVSTTTTTKCILLVEDDPMVRLALRRLLSGAGYEVLTAIDGRDAEAKAALHDAPIDVLLTDLVMPGMDGLQLARQFASEYPQMRAMVMTGYADDVGARRGLDDTPFPIVEKPFSAKELLAALAKLLASER